jgi:RNA polymerase sigma-70 factor (ECF subfamily)
MAAKVRSGFSQSASVGCLAVLDDSGDFTLLEAIRQAQQGDALAFEFLYRLHCRRVYALCLRMVRNASEAEDLAQETFLLLFRKIHTFRAESSFSTWLYRLTANIVLMHFRKNKAASVSLEEIFLRDGAKDLRMCGLFERADLEAAILQLSESHRANFLLHDVQGYQHAEIAGILGCSIAASKSNVHRARKQLRKALGRRLELSGPAT